MYYFWLQTLDAMTLEVTKKNTISISKKYDERLAVKLNGP